MVSFLIRILYLVYPFILFFSKEFRFLKLNFTEVEKDKLFTFYENSLGNVNLLITQ